MKKTIEDTAFSYLTNRDRSTEEMKKHLKEKEFTQEEIEAVIIYLTELNYLDDVRYCENYIRYAASKGKASLRIKMELAQKGIKGEIVKIALEENLDKREELGNAMVEAEKILRNAQGQLDDKLKGKIARRLASLGYRGEIIYSVLSKLG